LISRGVLPSAARQVAGDVALQAALEAALDLARGLALGGAPGGVGAGGGILLEAGEDDRVQRAVELAVACAVEAVADRLFPGKDVDRRGRRAGRRAGARP